MQIIKILIGIFGIVGLVFPSFASPPFQILQTCINDKPYNDKIIITRLPYLGAADRPLNDCEDQYNFSYNESNYGTLTCKDKFY